MTEPTAIVPDKGIRPGLANGADIARRIFVKAVAGSAEDAVEKATAATDITKGVAMEAITQDERGDVQVEGMAIVTSGGAVTRGAEVTSDGNGKAVAASSGNYVSGIARSAASGSDEDIEVELAGPGSGYIKP